MVSSSVSESASLTTISVGLLESASSASAVTATPARPAAAAARSAALLSVQQVWTGS